MRLLVTTQAVDLDDPVLGFFHRWLVELSKHVDAVEVICLKEGRHALPPNVTVHSLGKSAQGGPILGWERVRTQVKYVSRFYRYLWHMRGSYDAVFVHMNQEYVLMGALIWKLLGKRVVMWRNHKMGGPIAAIACRLVDVACYTSPSAFVAKFSNAVRMPIGIDTSVFAPATSSRSSDILFLGRLDSVKNPDIFLRAMRLLAREIDAHANVIGDPTPGREAYADELKREFSDLPNVTFHSGVRNDQTVALYQRHGVYVNLTPSGSFDKTIGEAMACGCIVVAANEVLRGVAPDELIIDPSSPEDVARGLKAVLGLSDSERNAIAERSRAWVEHEHSLALLAQRLAGILGE